jgi:hypothetical protein
MVGGGAESHQYRITSGSLKALCMASASSLMAARSRSRGVLSSIFSCIGGLARAPCRSMLLATLSLTVFSRRLLRTREWTTSTCSRNFQVTSYLRVLDICEGLGRSSAFHWLFAIQDCYRRHEPWRQDLHSSRHTMTGMSTFIGSRRSAR